MGRLSLKWFLWPSLRTHLSEQMTPRHLGNIHFVGNSCRDTLACTSWHWNYPGIFTCWYRSLLVAACKFGLLTIRRQCNQKTAIPVSSMWQVRSEKAKKWQASALFSATTSVHLSKLVSTDLILFLSWLDTRKTFDEILPNVLMLILLAT